MLGDFNLSATPDLEKNVLFNILNNIFKLHEKINTIPPIFLRKARDCTL